MIAISVHRWDARVGASVMERMACSPPGSFLPPEARTDRRDAPSAAGGSSERWVVVVVTQLVCERRPLRRPVRCVPITPRVCQRLLRQAAEHGDLQLPWVPGGLPRCCSALCRGGQLHESLRQYRHRVRLRGRTGEDTALRVRRPPRALGKADPTLGIVGVSLRNFLPRVGVPYEHHPQVIAVERVALGGFGAEAKHVADQLAVAQAEPALAQIPGVHQ